MRQQLAHRLGVFVIHCLEHAAALLARHLHEQVGEVVELHLFEDVRQTLHVESLNQAELFVLRHFFEHVSESLVVHRSGKQTTLLEWQCAHDRSHVTRVHVTEASSLGVDRSLGCKQRRDVIPLDQSVAGARVEESTLGETHLGDVPTAALSGRLGQSDVAHHLVTDALVEDVFADHSLTRTGMERVQVDVPGLEADPFVVHGGDPRGTDEDAAALAADDETQHPRGFQGATGHDDDVVDLADCASTRIQEWQAHHAECIHQFANHVTKATPVSFASLSAFTAPHQNR